MTRRGLFLDFDGTLVNSLAMLEDAYYSFLESFGCEGSRDEFLSLNGPSLNAIVQVLKRRYDLEPSLSELIQCYLAEIQRRDEQLAFNEGAGQLLEAAVSRDFSVAIVSSSPRSRIANFLESHDLLSLISLIVGAEDTELSKPDPAPYLAAIRSLSASPKASIAVEDSGAGVASAVSAGLPVLLLSSGAHDPEPSVFAHIDSLSAVLPYLAEGP